MVLSHNQCQVTKLMGKTGYEIVFSLSTAQADLGTKKFNEGKM